MNRRRLPPLLLALALLAVLAGCTVTEGGGAGTFDDGTYPAYKTIKIKLLDKPSTTIKIKDRYDINSDRILFYFLPDISPTTLFDASTINHYVTEIKYGSTVIPADQFFNAVFWYDTKPPITDPCSNTCDTVGLMIRNPLVPNVEYRLTLEGLVAGNTVQTPQTHPHTMFFDTGDHDDFPNVPYVQQSYPVYNQGVIAGGTYPEPYPPHEILELDFSEPMARFVMVIDGQEQSQLEQIRRYWGEFAFANAQGQLYNYDIDTQLRIVPTTGFNLNTIYNIYIAAEPPPFDGNTVYRPAPLLGYWFKATETPPAQDANGTRLVLTPASSAAVKHEGLFRVSRSSPQPSDGIDSFTLRFKTSRVRIENLVAGYRLQVNPADLPIDWTLPQVAGVLAQMDGGTVLPEITAVTLETPGPSGTVFTPATLGTTDGLTPDSFTAAYVPMHLAAGSTLSYLKARPVCPDCVTQNKPPGIDLITYVLDPTTADLGITISYPLENSTFNLARVAGSVTPSPTQVTQVTLYVNSIPIEAKEVLPGDTLFEFNRVPFEQGPNEIMVMAIWETSNVKVEKITAKFDSIPPSIVDTEPQNFVILRYLYHCPPPVGTCPVPLTGNDSIPNNQNITITFSEPVNPADIPALADSSDDAVYLQESVSGCALGTIVQSNLYVSTDNQHLIIDPVVTLNSTKTYEVVFMPQINSPPGNRIVDLAGNVLDFWPWYMAGGCYKLIFNVTAASDTSPPSVSWTLPDNGASNVSVNTDIRLRFDDSIDPTSITTSSFYLSLVVPGTISVVEGSTYHEFLFSPSSPLQYGTSYVINITNAVKDLAGNFMLSNYSSSFSTASSETYDTTPPFISYITLNQIESLFNCKNDPGIEDDAVEDTNSWLVVPPTGFSIDLEYGDTGVGIDPIDPAFLLSVTTDVPLPIGPRGTDFGYLFTATPIGATLTVSNNVQEHDLTFPVGMATIHVTVTDKNGNVSAQANYDFEVVEAMPDIMPFDTVQYIYLNFTRDYWGEWMNQYDVPNNLWEINFNYAPNGKADFEEEMVVIGLNTDQTPPIVPNTGGLNSNQVVQKLIKARIKQKLDQLFGVMTNDEGEEVYRDQDSFNIITVINPSLLPASSVPPSHDKPKSACANPDQFCDAPPLYNDPQYRYTDFCIGGGKMRGTTILNLRNYGNLNDGPSWGAGGGGQVDSQNDHQNSGCGRWAWDGVPLTSCEGNVALMVGQFVFGINFLYYNFPGGSQYTSHLFRIHFDPINRMYSLPECNVYGAGPVQCLPIGEHPLDTTVLDPTFDRTQYSANSPETKRFDQIMRAIEGYALQNGTLAAHEIGHSVGVAVGKETVYWPPPSYPPYYAFGGYKNNKVGETITNPVFPDSTLYHLYLRSYEPYGYFQGSAASIMDSGKLGYNNTQNPNTAFTSFDKAYLRQRTFYLEDAWPHYECADPSCVDQCPAP